MTEEEKSKAIAHTAETHDRSFEQGARAAFLNGVVRVQSRTYDGRIAFYDISKHGTGILMVPVEE